MVKTYKSLSGGSLLGPCPGPKSLGCSFGISLLSNKLPGGPPGPP